MFGSSRLQQMCFLIKIPQICPFRCRSTQSNTKHPVLVLKGKKSEMWAIIHGCLRLCRDGSSGCMQRAICMSQQWLKQEALSPCAWALAHTHRISCRFSTATWLSVMFTCSTAFSPRVLIYDQISVRVSDCPSSSCCSDVPLSLSTAGPTQELLQLPLSLFSPCSFGLEMLSVMVTFLLGGFKHKGVRFCFVSDGSW